MPVSSTDLVLYGSANMPSTDVATTGGAVDLTTKMSFTDVSTPTTMRVRSSSASDTTQTVTLTGRGTDGNILTSTVTLSGTTNVNFVGTFERLIEAIKSATSVGDVIIETSGGTEMMRMDKTPNEIFKITRLFYGMAADPTGGATQLFYQKVFMRNNHTTLALTAATIAEQADPSGKIDFALCTALGDTATVANRKTAPASGISAFDNTTKNVANSQSHSPGTVQGIWARLTLLAGDAASNTSWTVREQGQTI